MAARAAIYWVPALLWTCLVLLASSDAFSAQNTGGVLAAIALFLLGGISTHTFAVLHLVIRKAAHFTEYAILSWLWFRAWRGPVAEHRWRWAAMAVAISLATAISDEIHQTFVPSRTGEVRDVLLDLTGALFAQILVWAFTSRRYRSAPSV